MTIVVLMMLAAVWVAVLLPPFLRKRAEVRPSTSISSFRKQLIVLERTCPGNRTASGLPRAGLRPMPVGELMLLTKPEPSRPRARLTRSHIRRRRRNVLLGLLAADTIALLMVAVGPSMGTALVFVVTVVTTALYVALLVRTQRLAVERRHKLRHLPRPLIIDSTVPARRSAAL